MPGMLVFGTGAVEQLRPVDNGSGTKTREAMQPTIKKTTGHAKVITAAIHLPSGGYCQKQSITVEVFSQGTGIYVRGMGAKATKEVLLKTLTALGSLGYAVPGREVQITLSPAAKNADTARYYCLPIALALLKASGAEKFELPRRIIAGDLDLEGNIAQDLVKELHTAATLREMIDNLKGKQI